MNTAPKPVSNGKADPMDDLSDHSLLRSVEVWKACAESQQFECVSGHYKDCLALSESTKGSAEEPMISEVRTSGLPRVFTDLSTVTSPRIEHAIADGVTSALGVPTLIGGEVSAVTLMYFSEAPGIVGAIESWVPDRRRRELTLGAGHYINLGLFEKTSRCIKWPFGAGLPGLTWRTSMPQLVAGIGRSPSFIRGSDAYDAGLDVGVSLPIFTDLENVRAIVLLLSSTHSPLAKVFGLWIPESDGHNLCLERLCVSEGTEAHAEDWVGKLKCQAFEGIAGKAWASRTPVLEADFANTPTPEAMHRVCKEPLNWALAIPSIVGNHVHAVCTLYG